jgi:HlyD family secretion protein
VTTPTRSPSPGARLRRPGVVIPLALFVALVVAFAVMRLRAVPVVATPVVRGKAVDAVYATGTVEAQDRVTVKAKSSGSIVELLVSAGSSVKRGDLLARVDNPIVSFDLKRGQADLSAANAQAGTSSPQVAALKAQADGLRAELTTARQDLARAESLAKSGSVTPAELDRQRSRVVQLDATLAANDAQQRALRIDLAANAARQAAAVQSLTSRVTDTEVRAPMDGVILSKAVEIGEVVAVNQPLFRVGDTRSLILEVSVDEADIGRVRDGSGGRPASAVAISLYAFPKDVFRGRVFEVMPDANRERKAFVTKVRFDDPPEGLRSGMSAEVNVIALEKDGALLAPSVAEDGGFVWLVQDGHAHRRAVQTGVRDLLRVELLSGVAEGDLVITEGRDRIEDGTRVIPTVKADDKRAPMPDRTQPGKAALR